jgi:hypothetical protein
MVNKKLNSTKVSLDIQSNQLFIRLKEKWLHRSVKKIRVHKRKGLSGFDQLEGNLTVFDQKNLNRKV